ncbi:hypothetical protein MMC24_004234 [Lignoscripta atroalba]|nr:hypothetical protein [Lignoscripta atroalba]
MLKQIHNPYKCSSQKLRTLHALRTTLNLDMLFNMSTLQYADGKRLVAETEGARADMAPGTYEETVGALEKDLVVLAGIIGKVTAFGEGFGVMERRLRGEISSGCGGDSHDENEKEEVKAREVSVKDLKSLLRLVDKIMESQV